MPNLICECGRKLKYVADYGAPGIGSEWECESCLQKYRKVGNWLTKIENINPEDGS